MKAKKIHTRAKAETQEGKEIREAVNALANAAQAGDTEAEQILRDTTEETQKIFATVKAAVRGLNRSNRAAIAIALNALLGLEQVSHTKTGLQEFTSGLFRIIEGAQNRLLKLTGAPGIITQEALRELCVARGGFPDIRPGAAFTYWREKCNREFEAGYLVEPGDFYIKRLRDRSSGQSFIAIGSKAHHREIREASKSRRQAAVSDGVKIDTPTPDQLQAWFDLPSEPPHAEGRL